MNHATVNIRNIMTTDVVTIRESEPLYKAASVLAEKNISGVPVISEAGQVVGMISDGDILRFLNTYDPKKDVVCRQSESDDYKICMHKLGIFTIEPNRASDLYRVFEEASGKPVREFMTKNVVTIDADDDVEKASSLMISHKIKRIPVVENGILVGIVSRADIVKYVSQRKRASEYASSGVCRVF